MSRNGLTQWGWRDMEELLQCPVCLDIPGNGIVEQCRHGHHICASCKKNVDSCPLCKCEFHGTRNFILEELVRNFDVLKNTMLLNNIETEDKPRKIKIRRCKLRKDHTTQILKNLPSRRPLRTPNCTKGIYPCRVDDCNLELPLSRLLNHVRTYHAENLVESELDFTAIYSQTFEIPFKNKKPINQNTFIFFASGIGLIYLNVEILRSGQLIVYLQMASQFKIAHEFLGSIQFYSETTNYTYNTRLVSTRVNFVTLLSTSDCYTLNKNQLRKICVNKKFNCKFTLTHFNEADFDILTVPQLEQIRFIAGVRASLVPHEFDKGLVKEIEGTYKVVNTTKTQQSNGNEDSIQDIVTIVLQRLNLEDARNCTGNNSNSASTSGGAQRESNRRKKTRGVVQLKQIRPSCSST